MAKYEVYVAKSRRTVWVAEYNGQFLGKKYRNSPVGLHKIDRAFMWKSREKAEEQSLIYGRPILSKKGINQFNILHVRITTLMEILDKEKPQDEFFKTEEEPENLSVLPDEKETDSLVK